jgi:hypothetical protein
MHPAGERPIRAGHSRARRSPTARSRKSSADALRRDHPERGVAPIDAETPVRSPSHHHHPALQGEHTPDCRVCCQRPAENGSPSLVPEVLSSLVHQPRRARVDVDVSTDVTSAFRCDEIPGPLQPRRVCDASVFDARRSAELHAGQVAAPMCAAPCAAGVLVRCPAHLGSRITSSHCALNQVSARRCAQVRETSAAQTMDRPGRVRGDGCQITQWRTVGAFAPPIGRCSAERLPDSVGWCGGPASVRTHGHLRQHFQLRP